MTDTTKKPSVRATIIIKAKDYERLSFIADKENRSISGQAVYFIKKCVGKWVGDND